MKKISTLIISALMLFSLTACRDTSSGNGTSSDRTGQNSGSASKLDSAGTQNESSSTQGETAPSESESAKTLVAYFSATNTTKEIAEKIAKAVSGNLYEIIPQDPYTSADLNYNNSKSRSSVEMNDPDIRPAILGSVDNMEQYDIVFIGYPIWWGDAPRIVSTFAESYDFSGKTVVPFCTSSSSGVGSSASNLKRQSGSGNWLDGTRLKSNSSDSDISGWINGLGLNL